MCVIYVCPPQFKRFTQFCSATVPKMAEIRKKLEARFAKNRPSESGSGVIHWILSGFEVEKMQ